MMVDKGLVSIEVNVLTENVIYILSSTDEDCSFLTSPRNVFHL